MLAGQLLGGTHRWSRIARGQVYRAPQPAGCAQPCSLPPAPRTTSAPSAAGSRVCHRLDELHDNNLILSSPMASALTADGPGVEWNGWDGYVPAVSCRSRSAGARAGRPTSLLDLTQGTHGLLPTSCPTRDSTCGA